MNEKRAIHKACLPLNGARLVRPVGPDLTKHVHDAKSLSLITNSSIFTMFSFQIKNKGGGREREEKKVIYSDHAFDEVLGKACLFYLLLITYAIRLYVRGFGFVSYDGSVRVVIISNTSENGIFFRVKNNNNNIHFNLQVLILRIVPDLVLIHKLLSLTLTQFNITIIDVFQNCELK